MASFRDIYSYENDGKHNFMIVPHIYNLQRSINTKDLLLHSSLAQRNSISAVYPSTGIFHITFLIVVHLLKDELL